MNSSPEVGISQGKVWGTTRSLFCHNNVECHLIDFKKGGYCSQHVHRSKYNRFVVLRGVLQVLQWANSNSDVPDVTILSGGDVCDVAPGIMHCFEAESDGEAIEIYWSDLDPDDIDRCGTCGGKK